MAEVTDSFLLLEGHVRHKRKAGTVVNSCVPRADGEPKQTLPLHGVPRAALGSTSSRHPRTSPSLPHRLHSLLPGLGHPSLRVSGHTWRCAVGNPPPPTPHRKLRLCMYGLQTMPGVTFPLPLSSLCLLCHDSPRVHK